MDLNFKTTFDILGPSLLQGLGVVFQATFSSFFIALILGLLIALGRRSSISPLRWVLTIIVEIIRGTPLLVQLFYVYYVIPLLLNYAWGLIGVEMNVQLSALQSGIIGLSINYGCYLSEVYRSSIEAVDTGQDEAGRALGFNSFQIMTRLVLPIALRNALPVFGNYLVMLIKDTSLLAVISVSELLLRTQVFASQTFLTIESYTLLALVYLLISLPLSQCMKWLERKLKID